MKKILFLMFCVGIMTSCNASGKSKSEQGRNHSATATTDGTASKKPHETVDFTTPDLMLFDVKDHVEKVDYDNVDSYTITFDENGYVTSCPCYDEDLDFEFKNGKVLGKNFTSKRNAKGQLIKYAYDPGMGDKHWYLDVYEIAYNDKGQVQTMEHGGWESGEMITYTYDEKGLCIKMESDYGVEAISGKLTTTYIYTKFDDQGNWVERKLKMHDVQTDESTDEGTNVKDSEDVEKRTITYYAHAKR